MRLTICIISIFLLGSSLSIMGQTEKKNVDCSKCLTDKSFISDGQHHELTVKNSKYSKLFVIFYPKFNYRIVICRKDKNLIEFRLTDIHGKLLFTNSNKDYISAWDFQFSSVMNAVIELKLAEENTLEENVNVLISYQIAKTP